MTIYLPKPYPDELLYSVIARYVSYAGTTNTFTLKMNLFGGYLWLSPFLPRGLSTFSQLTWAVWHMRGQEIARRLTMYPYDVAFIPSPEKEEVMNDLLTTTPPAFVTYLLSRQEPSHLRYCEKCRDTDVAKYGEGYWKRIHQMKGVAICPYHGDELIKEPCVNNTIGAQLVTPTETTGRRHVSVLKLNQREKKQLQAIARRCSSILQEKVDKQWLNADAVLYRAIALRKGLNNQDGCCPQIVSIFKEIYSDKVIGTFQHSQSKNVPAWLCKIFCSNDSQTYLPVAHAVSQEFLSAIP